MSSQRTQPVRPQATLYVVVFGNLYVKFGVGLLLTFMLLQPIASLYAAGEEEAAPVVASTPEPESEPVVEEVAEEPEPEAVEEEIDSSEAVDETTEDAVVAGESDETAGSVSGEEEKNEEPEPEIVEEVTDSPDVLDESSENLLDETAEEKATSTDEVEVIETEATSTEMISEAGKSTSTTEIVEDNGVTDSGANAGSAGSGGGGDSLSETSTSTNEVSSTTPTVEEDSTAETVDDDETLQIDQIDNTDSGTENNDGAVEKVVADMVDSNLNANSGEVAGISTTTTPDPQIINISSDDNPLHFTDAECVSVADGSFYCSKDTAGNTGERGSAVYAAPDSEGDYEIYFRSDKGEEQITDNQFDDKSPAYDPLSETIVWHRLQNGRYQIMLYSLESGEMKQLTNDGNNNMEPAHESGVTVWQAWLDGNWEVMMFSGVSTTRITNNQTHDIAPDIQGGYVIWQTTDNQGEKGAMVYEVESGLSSPIDDGGGGQIVNPRFVLVYDTKFSNGDVVTKGFDPATGNVVPLSAQTGDLPVDIPSPEPTGETQALIQNKAPSGKEELVDNIDAGNIPKTKASTTPTEAVNNSATTSTATDSALSEIDTLVIEKPATSTSTSTEDVLNEESESSEVEAGADLVEEDDSGNVNSETMTEESDVLPLTEFDLIVEPYSSSSSTQEGNSTNTTIGVE